MVALGWCLIDDLLGVVSNCCAPWDGVHDIVHLMISFSGVQVLFSLESCQNSDFLGWRPIVPLLKVVSL